MATRTREGREDEELEKNPNKYRGTVKRTALDAERKLKEGGLEYDCEGGNGTERRTGSKRRGGDQLEATREKQKENEGDREERKKKKEVD